jgi:AcrR family transcriptional regulator
VTQPDPAPLGLRERKKLLARRALERAAFDLFARQGYDATTVDDIAEAARVSRASFFRYFTAKEDVLSGDDEERRDAFFAALDERDDQPVLDALRLAVRTVLAGMDDRAIQRGVTYARVMRGSRTLLGRAYEVRLRWLAGLEEWLRHRLAGRADLDVLAPVLADVVLGVLETALRLAGSATGRVDVAALVDRGFALLRPDLGAEPS